MQYNEDKSNIKLLSVMAYLGPLFLMSLFSVEKDNPDVKFHSKQGAVLFVTMILSYFLSYLIVCSFYLFPAVAEIIGVFLLVLLSVSWVVLVVMGVSGALKNEKVPLPFIYNIIKMIEERK